MFNKKSNKTAVIIGLGEFGLHLSLNLSKAGCDCIVADIDSNKIENIKNFVMKAVVMDVRQKNSLQQIVAQDTNFVIIAVGNIEASIMASLYLKDMKISLVYVKAVSEEHERLLRMMGIENVLFPEKDMGTRFATKLMSNNLVDFVPLSEDYSVAELSPLPSMENQTLKDINFRKLYDLTIIAIKKDVNPPEIVISPEANYLLKAPSKLIVLGKKKAIEDYNAKTV